MSKKKSSATKKNSRFLIRLQSLGTSEERSYIIENLGMLLSAGMDIVTALQSIKQEIRSAWLKKIIDQIDEDIASGFSLGLALERTGLFPRSVTSLLKIGEASGRLEKSLNVVVVQQEKNRTFKSKIRSAAMYPLFVLGLALVAGIGIAWFILPRLATVFTSLNLKLPLVTKVLMQLGAFLSAYGNIAIPLFVLTLAVLGYFIFFFGPTRFIGQTILFFIPGVKELIRETELARFGYIMGTLLDGGLPVVEAIDSLGSAESLIAFRKFYRHLSETINNGGTFAEAFTTFHHAKRLIPMPVQGLIIAGEQSGKLTKTFLKIADIYDAKTDITTKNLSVILEPILLVIVWLGVVAVALAVILPIYSLVGGLSQQESTNPEGVGMPAQAVQHISTPSTVAASTPRSQVSSPTLVITTTGSASLRVHASATTTAPVIGQAPSGTQYHFTSQENGWYAIDFASTTGWVSAQYVKIISP